MGLFGTAQPPRVGRKLAPHPETRATRGFRPLPRRRGEVTSPAINSLQAGMTKENKT